MRVPYQGLQNNVIRSPVQAIAFRRSQCALLLVIRNELNQSPCVDDPRFGGFDG